MLHVVPVQHPLAHDVASHTQRPPTQRCPPAHAGSPPHVHLPAAEQPSAVEVEHWTHAVPPVPHDAIVDALHVIPLQQPSGHVQPEQAPAAQVSPAGQAEHASPALPHAVGALPGWHLPPSQHPVGQEVASHVHVPALHRCPAAQAAALPHVHAPAVEQESLVVESQPAQTQVPPTHCWPAAQGGPPPHVGPPPPL